MNQKSNPYRAHDADPRSVYIHIPFCRHRCGYCNFALVAGRDHLIDPFLDALQTEINLVSGNFEIDTLFLGGGTPSHLSEKQLHRLGQIVQSKFSFTEGAEISAECNPSDISRESLACLTAIGVNRISLGVQSFHTDKLRVLERDHDGEIAKRAFELAMQATGNVSMDLIFATPNETQQQWEEDLQTAIALNPSHLSTYELTWEKGTTFWNRKQRGDLDGSNEDLRVDMYQTAIDRCNSVGLGQYEVSSFAKTEMRCRHNMQYWLCNPWFAFGPGAASFVGGTRNTNHRSPTTWIKRLMEGQSPINETEPLSNRERTVERLIFGLRTMEGIDVAAFEAASGVTLDDLAGDTIKLLAERGLIDWGPGSLKLTATGMMVADSVACDLLPD